MFMFRSIEELKVTTIFILMKDKYVSLDNHENYIRRNKLCFKLIEKV